MRRRLLSPKWLALHTLLVVSLVSFVLLGKWQFVRGTSLHGTIRNLLYAVQWWIFAGFAVFFWWKMLLSDLEDQRRGNAPVIAGPPEAEAEAAGRPGSVRSSGFELPDLHDLDDLDEDDPEDAKLLAYNRYLAELNQRYERFHRV